MGLEALSRDTVGNEVLTTGDAKGWMRVTGTSEDDLIKSLIPTATRTVENDLRRSLRITTWQAVFLATRSAHVELPRPPFRSLSSVDAWDEDEQAWESVPLADTLVREDAMLPVLGHVDDEWPHARLRVQYEAGYDATDVPGEALRAVKNVVAWRYMHRGDEPTQAGIAGSIGEKPDARQIAGSLYVPARPRILTP